MISRGQARAYITRCVTSLRVIEMQFIKFPRRIFVFSIFISFPPSPSPLTVVDRFARDGCHAAVLWAIQRPRQMGKKRAISATSVVYYTSLYCNFFFSCTSSNIKRNLIINELKYTVFNFYVFRSFLCTHWIGRFFAVFILLRVQKNNFFFQTATII